MSSSQSLPRLLGASSLALVVAFGLALAEPSKDFEPTVGQPGKDVIWVPTAQALVDKMLDMAKVTPSDFVMDLGSGDGRTVITAAKRGAKALGIEYNPDMIALSRRNAQAAGVAERAEFREADLFATDFSQATVITMFLLPSINIKLKPKILEMRPGTRVVSNSFDMADWTPEETAEAVEGCRTYCRAHFWVVPAKVEGTWKLPDDGELRLQQTYQMIEGSLRVGTSNMPISNGKVIGDQIVFTAGDARYTGRVNGNAIEGIAKLPSAGKRHDSDWRAPVACGTGRLIPSSALPPTSGRRRRRLGSSVRR